MNIRTAERRVDQIGLDLKLERTRRRLRQRDVAELAGMRAPRLCMIENGKSIPTLDEVHRIQKALESNGTKQ